MKYKMNHQNDEETNDDEKTSRYTLKYNSESQDSDFSATNYVDRTGKEWQDPKKSPAAMKRLIASGGHCNVRIRNVPHRSQAFAKDIFTTAIDMQWRYTILAFTTSFFATWTIFAFIWYWICWHNGDFEEENLPNGDAQLNGTHVPCVLAMYNFASAYLFSVETQHTIGYGSRQTSEECPIAIIVMSIQSVIGVLSSSCMAGIVFAKLARPKHRTSTVMFSKNAVMTRLKNDLFLIFRIGNIRKSHLIEAHVRAQMITSYPKKEANGQITVHFVEQDIKVSTSYIDEEEKAFMVLPTTVYHKIDETSPFYAKSEDDIKNSAFELIVMFEAIVEPTGNSVQARTSYLPREILWGYEFENMVSYGVTKHKGVYVVDCSYLNAVVESDKDMTQITEMATRKITSAKLTHHNDWSIGAKTSDVNEVIKEIRKRSQMHTSERLGRFMKSKCKSPIPPRSISDDITASTQSNISVEEENNDQYNHHQNQMNYTSSTLS